MASLVGKWVRDVLTARVVNYYRADDLELPEVSGYHDPVTTRFIRAIDLASGAMLAQIGNLPCPSLKMRFSGFPAREGPASDRIRFP